MTKVAIPILSSAGWLTDPDQTMAEIFFNTLASKYSQSNVFTGNVASLQYLSTLYATDPDKLCLEARKMYRSLYSRYYTSVDVTFELVDDGKTLMSFSFSVTGNRDGVSYSLSRTLRRIEDSGELKLAELA